MSNYWNWINRHVDAVLLISMLCAVLALVTGCATPPQTGNIDYNFCNAGMRGDYRIGTQYNEDGTTEPVLFVFHVGGPYENTDIICAISGDHAILDLGKGKTL